MRHATLLAPLALALMVSSAQAGSVIGIGTFFGISTPTGGEEVEMNASKGGPLYGVRIPMALGGAFSFEPFFQRIDGVSKDVFNGTTDGLDVTSYGANIALGRLVNNKPGKIHFAILGGGMLNKARREGGPSSDEVGWEAGLQIGIASSEGAHWSLRGTYDSIGTYEGELKARNYYNISLGLNCIVSPR